MNRSKPIGGPIQRSLPAVAVPSDELVLRTELAGRLRKAAKAMSVVLSDDQIEHAIAYAELLLQWNRCVNLTGIRTLQGVVIKHFIDCLAIVDQVVGTRVIDIGSGAGFPGIAVALARPDLDVWLLDGNSKKIQFLRHAIARFGFCNVQVVHQRIQQLAMDEKFDTAMVRGLGAMATIAEMALPVIASQGRVIAMKGRFPTQELAALPSTCQVTVRNLKVPYLVGERHTVILQHPD